MGRGWPDRPSTSRMNVCWWKDIRTWSHCIRQVSRRGSQWRNFADHRSAAADKKYTNHLTIIYDGDGAGIKAALRGWTWHWKRVLDVKLVLIPDKEDPDSYVRKLGAAAFPGFCSGG